MQHVQNSALARFLQIKQEISRLEKEQKAIKSQIEAAGGNFETSQFVVSTTEYETNRTVDCETLLERVGIVECAKLRLINTTTAKRLSVERKELGQKAG